MAASFSLQSIPEPLRQPMIVAIGASLVIHGLIGISFSSAKPPAPPARPGVKVVELSSLEQGRLPQSVTQASLPVPTTVPPLPTNPLLPNLKSPNPSFPDNSLYTIPYAPPPPIPWYWTPPLRQAPATNQARRSPNQTKPSNRTLQPQTPARQFPTSLQPGQQYTIGEGFKFNTPDSPATNPDKPVNRTRPDKIAATTVEQLRQLQQQKRGGSGYDSSGTSPEAASDLLNQWLAKVENEAAKQNMQNIKLVSEAAPANLTGAAAVAVLVDAQGKIVGEPEVFQSSGYKTLNTAALATVKGHTFQAAPTDRVYLIRVEFNPQARTTNPTQPAGPG